MLNHRHLSLSKGDVTDRALAPAPHIVPTPRIAQQPAQILNVLRRLRRRQIRTLNLLSLVEAALQRDGDRKILPRFCRCARQTGGLTQNRFCIIGLTGHDVRDAKIGEDARIVRLQRQRFLISLTRFRETAQLIERRAQRRTDAPIIRFSRGNDREWAQRLLRTLKCDHRIAKRRHQLAIVGKAAERLARNLRSAIRASAFAQRFREMLRCLKIVRESLIFTGPERHLRQRIFARHLFASVPINRACARRRARQTFWNVTTL